MPITLFANATYDFIVEGGPIMAPLLIAVFLACTVLLERSLWWLALRRRRDETALQNTWDALALGDFPRAFDLSRNASDPFLATLHQGLSHSHSCFLGAMQIHAARFLASAEKRLWILSTLITLAPLLGLMGTVIGIMHSFSFVGNAELAASKVSGGIGEALIATAFGLGIAITCLLPYNYFRRRHQGLRDDMELMINHTELVVEAAKHHGHDLESYSRQRAIDKLSSSRS
jgi:biopolymer transport protein ExbB